MSLPPLSLSLTWSVRSIKSAETCSSCEWLTWYRDTLSWFCSKLLCANVGLPSTPYSCRLSCSVFHLLTEWDTPWAQIGWKLWKTWKSQNALQVKRRSWCLLQPAHIVFSLFIVLCLRTWLVGLISLLCSNLCPLKCTFVFLFKNLLHFLCDVLTLESMC